MPQFLTPVSFHLRNFNKYLKLDLSASELGNMTLVGENMAGKTTLANCFFPVLVDGSITTASFNPVRGTEKLDSDGKARNSKREPRNFESMLLSWGPGAMKARTGYTYMRMVSDERQVILGIGAYRGVGDTNAPTWWFVVDAEPGVNIDLQTVTDAGKSLGHKEFIAANAHLGDSLHIFTRPNEYHDFVASHVYGFTERTQLDQLANAYRLLASPILTSGGAKFTPIKKALKASQAGIDPDVMNGAATKERLVNSRSALLFRIQRGIEKLGELQDEIFWRNLNQLSLKQLAEYTDTGARLNEQRQIAATSQEAADNYSKQLVTARENLGSATERLDTLREKKVQQASAAELRQFLQQEIATKQQTIDDFVQAVKRLVTLEGNINANAAEIQDNEQATGALQTGRLRQVQATLSTQSAQLTELASAMAQANLAATVTALKKYVRSVDQHLTTYRSTAKLMGTLEKDVAIVSGMRVSMDERINQHVQMPMASHVRTVLHQDNLEVHEDGAAKMNAEFAKLRQKQSDLVAAHPDVPIYLNDASRLKTVQSAVKELQAVTEDIDKLVAQKKNLTANQQHLFAQREQLVGGMHRVDLSGMKQQINNAQERLSQIHLDTQIDEKINTAKKHVTNFEQMVTDLTTKNSTAEAKARAAVVSSDALQAQLTACDDKIMAIIKILQPYAPANADLTDVTAVTSFVREHRSRVKNADIMQLVDRIRRVIHGDGGDNDRYALDVLFDELDRTDLVSRLDEHAVKLSNDVIGVHFDIRKEIEYLNRRAAGVEEALNVAKTASELSLTNYMVAAVNLIKEQFRQIDVYNAMLADGLNRNGGIALKVELRASTVDPAVIEESMNGLLTDRPLLRAEIKSRMQLLENDAKLENDDDTFADEVAEKFDVRNWTDFVVLIRRAHQADDAYEEVDDNFVQAAGSGAEKAQAMVLPLLLVPKMLLQQATRKDVPHLVMFDEFADKLDPDTARAFTKTIANFGFTFIATMPSGAQNKVLADGVTNGIYEVIAPSVSDRNFRVNSVVEVGQWGDFDDDSVE